MHWLPKNRHCHWYPQRLYDRLHLLSNRCLCSLAEWSPVDMVETDSLHGPLAFWLLPHLNIRAIPSHQSPRCRGCPFHSCASNIAPRRIYVGPLKALNQTGWRLGGSDWYYLSSALSWSANSFRTSCCLKLVTKTKAVCVAFLYKI